jgi:hypothetical protein
MAKTKECKHVWVIYHSRKQRQCIDCKMIMPINDRPFLTEHNRRSNIQRGQ